MTTDKIKTKTIDTFIAGYPGETQTLLRQLRSTIKKVVPNAEEVINYGIPTFDLHSRHLVHFAAFKNHIGFYPTPSSIEEFKKELSEYKSAKGSVQFPIDKPLPLGLITKIVRFRVKEILKKREKVTMAMKTKNIATGTVHSVPSDLRKALASDPNALTKWNDLTPLARNEWICWVNFVKKAETRKEHFQRTISEIKEGMRRPCCWIGCIHRTDKLISPSVQGVLSKRNKKSQKVK